MTHQKMHGKVFNMFDEMESIVENSGALIYVIDLETHKILFANKKCKEEFGDVLIKFVIKSYKKD